MGGGGEGVDRGPTTFPCTHSTYLPHTHAHTHPRFPLHTPFTHTSTPLPIAFLSRYPPTPQLPYTHFSPPTPTLSPFPPGLTTWRRRWQITVRPWPWSHTTPRPATIGRPCMSGWAGGEGGGGGGRHNDGAAGCNKMTLNPENPQTLHTKTNKTMTKNKPRKQ